MRSSEHTDKLAAALAEAQGKLPIVPKLHMAEIPTKNGGSYRYAYADLGDIVEASRPILAELGLAVLQMPGWEDGRDVLDTRVTHQSGQWVEGTMRLLVPDAATPQAQGSAVTYARRYAYCAALGIVADADDDGSLAQLAYAEGSSRTRKRRPPSTSTSTQRRPIRADPATDGAGLTAHDRNKIVAYFARQEGVTKTEEVLARVSETVGRDVESLVKLSAADGAALFATLGINP